jgi:Flp pilus assembly pilin Flp
MSSIWDESGTVMVEYALVLGLLSLAFIAGMFAIEGATNSTFSNLQNKLIDYGLRDGL